MGGLHPKPAHIADSNGMPSGEWQLPGGLTWLTGIPKAATEEWFGFIAILSPQNSPVTPVRPESSERYRILTSQAH